MKLPMSWLRDWVETDAPPERIAELLTTRGFYVEGVERRGGSFPGVVVARVLEVQKHPNADKLSLCRVDGGAGELRIVCGAPNVHAGMIVPLATVGATLPGGVTIRKSKIRGEESFGMLCSARELELSEDHQGILDLTTLDPNAAERPLGSPFDALLPPPDAVLEIEVPFNRPDGQGVVGLAREVRAALGAHWTPEATQRLERRWKGGTDFDLAVENEDDCPRYIAQAVANVAVGPSPAWVRARLEAMGQRPISNVVDATNLVLFELGQPLHAFDLERLTGPAIRVRRARAGESITTLDSKQRPLDPEVLVIADRDRPCALAGIMGGADSEVADGTRRLLLECAVFAPARVRRGSKRLALATEASRRFERGVDWALAPVATARFLDVLRESCPTLTLGPSREVAAARPAPARVPLRTSRYERVVGEKVTALEAAERLRGLEFAVEGGDPVVATVPSWRADIAIEDDLVEEVARSIGYDAIPEARLETGGAHATRSPDETLQRRARQAMLARGLHEAWCTTLVSESEARAAAALLGTDEQTLVRLTNPMSRENEVLRPNLVPGLLRACAHNLRQGTTAVRLFEVGAGFAAGAPLPRETTMLAAIVTGPSVAHAHTDATVTAKDTTLHPVDFDDAKGLWEAWLEDLSVDAPEWRPYSGPGWKPGASAEVASGTSRIGWAGTLGPSLLREWEIEIPVHLLVALLDPVRDASRRGPVVLPGRYPPVRRDLAFIVPDRTTHRAVGSSRVDLQACKLEYSIVSPK